MVYVDSGSTDGSVAYAQERGVEVVALDLSIPFTAARARNAGVERLVAVAPQLVFVQVLDGDCELVPEWLDVALARLQQEASLAVVCGRRRERFRQATLYNRLCDMEWDNPVGEVMSCGGDAMIRLAAFQQIGGYDATLIAGEEPEMCLRLRERGWRIERLGDDMTLHDANMTRLDQWWRRNVRAGHAYAEVYWRHRHSPCAIWGREVRSIVFWTLVLPLVITGASGLSRKARLAFAAYPWLWVRTRRHQLARGYSPDDASLYALFCLLAKFPQLAGGLTFAWNRLLHRQSQLIEYKSSAKPNPGAGH
jgi:GT2 family glycosyltransferase